MKILDLTTDCVFLPLRQRGDEVIHCQSGRALMYSGCPRNAPRGFIWKIMLRLLTARRFDWIVFPPVHVTWERGNGFARKTAKRFLRRLIKHPQITRFLRRLAIGRKTRVAIVDYSDQLHLSEFALSCLEPEHYFMVNVPAHAVGKRHGRGNSLVHYLPAVFEDRMLDTLASLKKDERRYDVFIAGNYHNSNRLDQLKAIRILENRPVMIRELKEKSFEDFSTGLANSRLCMAGRGTGYHCDRPLEAMATGAVPICHQPSHGTYHQYVHGKNCFIYDPSMRPDEIADFVQDILKDPDAIRKAALGGTEHIEQYHRASVLAANLRQILAGSRFDDNPPSIPPIPEPIP